MSIEQEIAGTVPATLEIAREEQATPLPENAKWSSAGIASLLSEDPMEIENTFGMLLTDFDKGSTATLERNVEREVRKESVASKDILLTELSKPETTLERKRAIISELANPPAWKKDSATLVAERNLMAPSAPTETVEQETRRTNIAELLKPVHEYRATVSQLRNNLVDRWENTSRFHTADSFLEGLLPYSTTSQGVDELQRIRKTLGMPSSMITDAVFTGSGKQAIRDALAKMPPEVATAKLKEIANELKKDSGLLIRDENALAALTLFDQLAGDYSKFDKFLDNSMFLIDSLFFISPAVSAAVKPVEKAMIANRLTKMLRSAELREVVDKTATRSAAKIAQATNPDKARAIHMQVVASKGDDFSRAAYGASREEAIVSDLAPQPVTPDGAVEVRVPDIDKKTISIEEDIAEAVRENVSYRYTDVEMRQATENIVHDFHNATGLHINTQMSQFGVDGDNVVVKTVYGNTEGGFLRAEDAVEKALAGLSKRGIKEEEITLLQNKGGRYEAVELEEVRGVDGDFLVQVDSRQAIADYDVGQFEGLKVIGNLLDRLPVFQWARSGNAQRWFVDAASMLDKHITGPASVAIDRAADLDKKVLHYFDDFAKSARTFGKDRQDKIMKRIIDNNAHEVDPSDFDLVAEGFSTAEIEVLRKWTKANDVMFYLENADLVRTLRNEGYMKFDNGSDTFFAKRVENSGLLEDVYDPSTRTYGKFSVDVYDPASQAIIKITENEIDALYNAGGHFARMRRPVEINGQMVDFLKVDRSAQFRALRDTDQVLNYKKGWFHVEYDRPVFVVKKVTDITGKTYEKRVAVASTRKEADEFIRMNARKDGVDPKDWGFPSEDKRAFLHDSDSYWDVQSASGRLAQRHRGKRLEGKTGTNFLGKDLDYIVDPIESSIKSAKSISARITTRPVLETMKARFKQQYAEFLDGDGMGGVRYPSKIGDIKAKDFTTGKDVADARTTFNYIQQLEEGYINTVDEGFKWLMNTAANIFSKGGLTSLEKGAYVLQNIAPAAKAKEAAYYALIATHPIRQLIVQPMQVMRLFSYAPSNFIGANSKVAAFLMDLTGISAKAGSEEAQFIKFMKDSGILSSVDRHNLVRGSLASMADSTHASKRIAGKVLNFPRKWGFDIGEQTNMLITNAIVWEKKKKAGLNVFDKRVMEEIHSEARALSYDMNIAGDMPYNQNWASVLTQFLQVPHKALLQPFNRRIPGWDRAKLAAIDLLLWGLPAYSISDWVGEDMLPEDKLLRSIVARGVFDTVWNNAITQMIGEDAMLDFKGSFSPYDMGWVAVAKSALVDKSFADALANTPSGRIFYGDNSRIGQAFTALGTFLHAGDYGNSAEQWRVAEKFLRISSGFASMSDAYKAAYIRKAGEAMTKEGVILDSERSNFEVMMSAAGIQNRKIADLYRDSELYFSNEKKMKEDASKVLKEVMRHLHDISQEPNDTLLAQAQIMGEMERVFSHNPKVMAYVQSELKKAVSGKDEWLIGSMLRVIELGDYRPTTLMKRIEDSPAYSESDKEAARILLRDAQKAEEYFKEKE